MSTTNGKRITVRVTNATKSPYLIKKNTQIAEFSVVIPELSKYIKQLDKAILSMIPQGDLDLTAYLNELPERKNPSRKTALSGYRHWKTRASCPKTDKSPQRTI